MNYLDRFLEKRRFLVRRTKDKNKSASAKPDPQSKDGHDACSGRLSTVADSDDSLIMRSGQEDYGWRTSGLVLESSMSGNVTAGSLVSVAKTGPALTTNYEHPGDSHCCG